MGKVGGSFSCVEYRLSSVRTEYGHLFFVLVVMGLFDDIVPIAFGDVDEEDVACLVILDAVLKFLRHHFFAEEPTGITVSRIAIHGILIGKLVPGSAGAGLLHDQLLQAVDLGVGKGRAIEEDIACAVGEGLCGIENFIGNIADGEDIAFVLAEQAFADDRRVFAGGYVKDDGFEGGIGGDILLRLVHGRDLLEFFVNRLLRKYGC
jgi:hypothetical protein